MLTVEAVIILRNGPEQNETVASHYFMENRTKQLRHIIYGEQNETVASHYFMENRTKQLRHIILWNGAGSYCTILT